ncbi:MAG: hypothetical protein ACPL7L_02265, partial [bacterium]
MPVHTQRLFFWWAFALLFVGILGISPYPLSAQETRSAPSHLFQVIYQWEPLQESEGVPRVTALTSDRPRDVLQDENLLAFVVRERILVLVDLATQKVLYEREFSEKCILHGLHRGYITYSLGDEPKTHVLSGAGWRERTFPGTLVCPAHEGFV